MVVCVDITTLIREDIVEYQISIYVGVFYNQIISIYTYDIKINVFDT